MYTIKVSASGLTKNIFVTQEMVDNCKIRYRKNGSKELPFAHSTRKELELSEERIKALSDEKKAKVIAYEVFQDFLLKSNLNTPQSVDCMEVKIFEDAKGINFVPTNKRPWVETHVAHVSVTRTT